MPLGKYSMNDHSRDVQTPVRPGNARPATNAVQGEKSRVWRPPTIRSLGPLTETRDAQNPSSLEIFVFYDKDVKS